ncbi:hypothetical protein BST27_21440 [Mycobacterium intermedium]|uniref:PknH-like extracellular domain-containing protein n=1 Tax=Mycobacterium intermedium TaxID=28445 RepID=A0A1E3S9N6_MYCIE|nr:hypothetical protein BHQ20_20135 [Mycobacterium intermedium]OPE47678.1 hypothetical protein BV508_21065 [Mycobacterium intermedium]ORA98026.1 hypothetical protein BST27_21440 [Mycobacterium intermedium]
MALGASGASADDPELMQAVVLFPSANAARAFFTNSADGRPACANRTLTIPGDADNPEIHRQVGPVSHTNGVLSTITTVTFAKDGNSFRGVYQRALTVRNNVAIDVSAGGKAAEQIAARVTSCRRGADLLLSP